MAKLELTYDDWNVEKDVYPDHLTSASAIAALLSGVNPKTGNLHNSVRNGPLVKATVGGVIASLVVAVERLRQYGMTEAEVENKVKSYLAGHRSTKRNVVLAAAGDSIEKVSDPLNKFPLIPKDKKKGLVS
tara:strand:- start:2766 stop:3158 length:393 start_codon:yes stop_codon:yes gene_type:complete